MNDADQNKYVVISLAYYWVALETVFLLAFFGKGAHNVYELSHGAVHIPFPFNELTMAAVRFFLVFNFCK